MTCSIFIASRVTSSWPASTWSPGATATAITVPGIGDSSDPTAATSSGTGKRVDLPEARSRRAGCARSGRRRPGAPGTAAGRRPPPCRPTRPRWSTDAAADLRPGLPRGRPAGSAARAAPRRRPRSRAGRPAAVDDLHPVGAVVEHEGLVGLAHVAPAGRHPPGPGRGRDRRTAARTQAAAAWSLTASRPARGAPRARPGRGGRGRRCRSGPRRTPGAAGCRTSRSRLVTTPASSARARASARRAAAPARVGAQAITLANMAS